MGLGLFLVGGRQRAGSRKYLEESIKENPNSSEVRKCTERNGWFYDWLNRWEREDCVMSHYYSVLFSIALGFVTSCLLSNQFANISSCLLPPPLFLSQFVSIQRRASLRHSILQPRHLFLYLWILTSSSIPFSILIFLTFMFYLICQFSSSFVQAYTLFGHIYSLLSSDNQAGGTRDTPTGIQDLEKEIEREKMININNEKALKCYLMALQIDPLNEEAGWGASEIYLMKTGK